MRKIDLGQTINTFANIGVIAGILFLAIEIRASTRATQASSIQTATALDQEHLLLVGADPDLAKL
jgi:large-conductance mechanosensitive channel